MENLEEKIKLPSSYSMVTVDAIWKMLTAISKTGNTFTKEQVISSGVITKNEDSIKRNLSYLKFLKIIEEERGKGETQRFKVLSESKEVKSVLYELKASREEGAKTHLRNHIIEHSLYISIRDDFFKKDTHKTLTDLEHFLKDGIEGKAPLYYQKGGEFLMKFLTMLNLVKLDGNDIELIIGNGSSAATLPEDNLDEGSNDEGEDASEGGTGRRNNSFGTKMKENKGDFYSVKIQSPNINFDITIKSIAHLTLVETFIAAIKTEFTEKNTNESQNDL